MNAPREKRPASEEVRARQRPPADTDMRFYNKMMWRRYSKHFRQQNPLCEIHMCYVLVNELQLGHILPWFSKLSNSMKAQFLRRKGFEGEILDTDVCDHIIPIKYPFNGSKMDPRNHQAASHTYHNMKRRMERDEQVEDYIDTATGRVPVRMEKGLKYL